MRAEAVLPDLKRDWLQPALQELGATHATTGFGIALQLGEQFEQVACGPANPELGTGMAGDTLVQIGSTAKLFNAALVMRLVEVGSLDLDRPVVELVDDFRLADDLATRTLTLRHCLTMTSGIAGGPFGDFGFDDDCLARYVAALADLPHQFPPGGGFGYSNAGSAVAGHAAERVTGQRWDDLLREHVLLPAGMAHTETLTDRLLFHRVAVGVDPSGAVHRPWYQTRSKGPSGSTCASTAADLVRFARLFLSGGRGADGTQVLSARSVAAMSEPAVPVATGFPAQHWCLGPSLIETAQGPALGHRGANVSGASVVWWVPERNAAVACVTNSPAAWGAIIRCADRILGELGCPPPPVPAADPDAAVELDDRFMGAYESDLLRCEVRAESGRLLLRAQGKGLLEGQVDAVRRLIPAGRDLFLPEEPLLPGTGIDTGTPIAFRDYAGVRILLNGNIAVPQRRPAQP